MLPEWTVVGFSGHRKLADEKVVAAGIRNAFERLATNYPPFATVSSAASGSDTLFVEEAARRKLPYLLILPFSKTRFQQDFKPDEWQRILPFIENATHVEEVSGEESNEGAYMETGILTADKADVMVVVWDGKPAAGLGGTGDVVNYVRELGKPLMIVEPVTGTISEERMAQLPAKSLPAAWNEKPRETLEKHFEELDKTAARHAPRSRHLVLRIVLFQLAASAVGLTALTFENHDSRGIINALSTPVELLLLGVAFISSLEHRKKLDEWMNSRIAAEVCRSFLAMWDMRRRPDHFPNLSIRGFGRLCRNLRIIRALDKTPPPPLQSACDRYLRERVDDQIQFFSSTSGTARINFRKLKGIMLGGTAAATLCSLVSFIHYSLKIKGWALIVPSYLSLLLPLVSTAAFLLIVTQDYSRRAVRYAEMLACLEDIKRRLKQVKTWNSLTRIGVETEEQLLQEIVEWHSFRRFAGEPN